MSYRKWSNTYLISDYPKYEGSQLLRNVHTDTKMQTASDTRTQMSPWITLWKLKISESVVINLLPSHRSINIHKLSSPYSKLIGEYQQNKYVQPLMHAASHTAMSPQSNLSLTLTPHSPKCQDQGDDSWKKYLLRSLKPRLVLSIWSLRFTPFGLFTKVIIEFHLLYLTASYFSLLEILFFFAVHYVWTRGHKRQPNACFFAFLAHTVSCKGSQFY